MNELYPIKELLDDHQMYHSDFQMDVLITTRSGGTTYGQYKQALRELFKRYRGLVSLYRESKIQEIDIQDLKSQGELSTPEGAKAKVEVDVKIASRYEREKSISDTEREFIRFYLQCNKLKSLVGHLDPKKRAILDRDLWIYNIRCKAAIELMSQGRVSQNTIEFMASLPREEKVKLLLEVRKPDNMVKWFIEHSPDRLEITYEEIIASVPHAKKIVGKMINSKLLEIA